MRLSRVDVMTVKSGRRSISITLVFISDPTKEKKKRKSEKKKRRKKKCSPSDTEGRTNSLFRHRVETFCKLFTLMWRWKPSFSGVCHDENYSSDSLNHFSVFGEEEWEHLLWVLLPRHSPAKALAWSTIPFIRKRIGKTLDRKMLMHISAGVN